MLKLPPEVPTIWTNYGRENQVECLLYSLLILDGNLAFAYEVNCENVIGRWVVTSSAMCLAITCSSKTGCLHLRCFEMLQTKTSIILGKVRKSMAGSGTPSYMQVLPPIKLYI